MNPTGESKVNGRLSITLGGMNFERQLSEKEADFFADVVETALSNNVEVRLQNRARAAAERNAQETREPES
jgi:hypothetical protein